MRMAIIIAIIILLLPLLLLAGAIVLNRVPLFEPPGFSERIRIYLGHNVAELQPDARFPELRPAVYPVKPALLCRQIPEALDALGWQWQRLADECHYQAVVTTPLLGFKDDVSISVEAVGDASSRLEVVSRSRIGRGDFGANIRHVRDLVRAIEEQ